MELQKSRLKGERLACRISIGSIWGHLSDFCGNCVSRMSRNVPRTVGQMIGMPPEAPREVFSLTMPLMGDVRLKRA